MGRLKRILKHQLKASSLTEVIVATTILLLVFAIALLTLNNIMVSSVQKDTQALDIQVEKLIYQYKNKQLKVPNSYAEDDYQIAIDKIKQNDIEWIDFSIMHSLNKKKSTKRIIAIKNENN